MRIKRIEIIGFKSFCDRTVLSFAEQIVGVVGPNGCGKSNIVDAIRWCMGEQSAKHLRGAAMGDVIFNGSDSRGPAGMAEVSLTFEDVGFSHETLNLALGDEAVLADPVLDGADPVAEDDGAEPVVAADGAELGSEVTAAPAEPPVDASAPVEPPADPYAASREVKDLLADQPPAIDFAQYSEVTITRRLFRDGTSLYFLNKTPCRLRDITDFFLGTGVGTKAYSIIEQGRIGQIVSARAQDRRHIIEEAAGITKFKAKKKAAERKLEQTRQNLLRVSDIVSELDKRLGSLRRQAQKAERFRKYRGELKDIELWMASHRYLELSAEDKLVHGLLDDRRTRHEAARGEFAVRDARVVAARAELGLEERRLGGLQEQLFDVDNRIQLGDSKVSYQRREAGELEGRVASAEAEIASLEVRLGDARTELATRTDEREALAGELGEGEATLGARVAAYGEARELYAAAQRQLEAARSQIMVVRGDLNRATSQRDAMVRRREDAARRLEVVAEEGAQGATRLAELEREVRRHDGELAGLRQTRLDLGSRTEALAARQTVLGDELDGHEAAVETLRTELHRRKSRLVSLREIHERYEGFARGTKAVMQHASSEGRGIHGLVADVLEAPERLEVAVEAALGDRLGGVLVESHDAGARAIQYLKDTSSGRSTFVPFQRTEGIAFEDRSGWLTAGEGVLGPMVDLVKIRDGYRGVAMSLLGDAVAVETLDQALALHQTGAARTFVTLDGDVVDGSGVVSGGSRDAQGSGVLAQKREIRELEEISGGLERDLADATARFVACKTELSQVQRALEGLRKEHHEGEMAMTVREKDLAVSRSEHDRLRERVARLNAEQLELEERLRQLAAEDLGLVDAAEVAQREIGRLEEVQLGLIGGVTGGQETVERLSTELTTAKVRMAQLGEQRASLEAAALRLEAAARELAGRIEKLGAAIGEDGERARTLRREADEIEGGLGELKAGRTGLALELSEGRVVYERRHAEIDADELEARKQRNEADELASEVSALEIKGERLGEARRHLEESMAERYRVSLARELGDYHLRSQIGPVEEERVAELRGLIERMGADINLTAIEEYNDIAKRHEFLATQQADLENAVGQLERAISKINKTSRALFRETFEAINAKFTECFPTLFRGGRAYLELTGDLDDVLEAGVEIMAQPPGKKNVTVDQLSGGEKALTAVALLFAIFLIKPSPFCLLDEVDAPLDEANVDRYNLALREMTKQSQFIVITHNKRTMEVADRLYGVTMQEPGVSKLVSVNLNKLEAVA